MKSSAYPALLSILLLAAVSLAWAENETTPKKARDKKPAAKASEQERIDAELKADLVKLQGSWHRTPIDAQGNVGKRQLKVIEGNLETLTNYDSEGNVARTNTVEFKLELSGAVKLFTFAPVGRIDDKNYQFSYIYKIDEDILYDVPGLLVDRRSYSNEPALYEWTRLRLPKSSEPAESFKK